MFTVKGISHIGHVTFVEGEKVQIDRSKEGEDFVRVYAEKGAEDWFYSFIVTNGVSSDDTPAVVKAAVIENAYGKTSEVVRAVD